MPYLATRSGTAWDAPASVPNHDFPLYCPVNAQPTPKAGAPSTMARIVERNIEALLARQQREQTETSVSDKIADAVTTFAGSLLFVWIHLALFGGWIAWNTGLLGLPPFDPSLVVLAMIASVEAIFLSTFVLISQNRMAIMANKRADLDLQVSLLAEHEITRLVSLVTQIARKMDIQDADDPELEELMANVHPENVLDSIEAYQQPNSPETDATPHNNSPNSMK